MADRSDLESAIMDAEGASAVLSILEIELTSSTDAGWKALRLQPREDLCVTTLSPVERQALDHASISLQRAVAEVSRVFYAAIEGGDAVNVPLTRRALVQGGAAVLGAAVAGIPASARAALPTAFDPAAFVDDLLAAGYRVSAYVGVPCGGLSVEPPSYIIRPPPGRRFGAGYRAVMARWADAISACPDHIERVVAYVFERHRATCGEAGT